MALTANAFEDDRRACLEAGMDDFLVKPLSLEALRARAGALDRARLDARSGARQGRLLEGNRPSRRPPRRGARMTANAAAVAARPRRRRLWDVLARSAARASR